MNSATETQTPSAKVAAPRHSSGRIIFRYGLALVLSPQQRPSGFWPTAAIFTESVFTFFLLAVALTSWYAGAWPAVIAFAVGELAFNYFFTPPPYSLSVTREDLAYFPVFAFFSGLLIWFGVVRRRAEADLRQSRDARSGNGAAASFERGTRKTFTSIYRPLTGIGGVCLFVSHDLRAPVRHIAGFTELLQKHAEPRTGRQESAPH